MASTARAAQAEGRRLFREGVQLIEREQREAACERFERANAYIVRDNNLWNIAICHVNFGRRDLALATKGFMHPDEGDALWDAPPTADMAELMETLTDRSAASG